jgi:uncharacterized protein (TIGR03435 family)
MLIRDVRPLLTAIVVMFAALIAATTLPLHGQAASDQKARSFEVASIKLNTSGDPLSGTHDLPGGRVTITNLPLRDVIRSAYGSNDLEVIGGPSWLDTERWDIVGAAAPSLQDGSWQLMMKSLLAERCGLQLHTDQREQPIFRLGFAANDQRLGPKIHTTGCKPENLDCASTSRRTNGIVSGTITAVASTMPHLAETLSRYAERRVFDGTGLHARYDFELEWSQDVSIFTALQEQLGLKLESARARVDVLVIDHVEKPTPD